MKSMNERKFLDLARKEQVHVILYIFVYLYTFFLQPIPKSEIYEKYLLGKFCFIKQIFSLDTTSAIRERLQGLI